MTRRTSRRFRRQVKSVSGSAEGQRNNSMRTGQLSLWPDHFFLAMNWTPERSSGEASLDHYRRGGIFEDRLTEVKNAVRPAYSSPRFEENEAAILLALLAHNLLGMARGLLEDQTGSGRDAARVRDTLLKTVGSSSVRVHCSWRWPRRPRLLGTFSLTRFRGCAVPVLPRNPASSLVGFRRPLTRTSVSSCSNER